VTSSLTARGSTRKWREIRRLVLIRDRGICWLDGLPGANSVDHVVPRELGGTDSLSNLRAAHLHCNSSRGVNAPSGPSPSREW
jgi:5-methylcytosine-specific restriction endonuclease McrA